MDIMKICRKRILFLTMCLAMLFSSINFADPAQPAAQAGTQAGTQAKPQEGGAVKSEKADKVDKKKMEADMKAEYQKIKKGDKLSDEQINKLVNEKGLDKKKIEKIISDGEYPTDGEIHSVVEAQANGKESMNMFVNAVDEVERVLGENIRKVVKTVLDTVSVLLVGIATLQVALTVLPLVTQRGIDKIPQGLFGNALKFGFVAYLLQGDNWWNFIQAIKKFFLRTGLNFSDKFRGSVDASSGSPVTTGNIAAFIMGAPFKVMAFVGDENVNLVWKLMFLITGLLLLLVCIKVLCDFLVAIVEYDLLGGLSGIYIIFLLFDKTQSFGMKAFNTLLSGAMKIMLIIAMIGITVQVTEEQQQLLSDGGKPTSIFIFCGIMAIMSYMCSIAPAQAQSLVAGGGGAASGSGFIQSMAKQAVTAVTTTAAIAVGAGGLVGAIKGAISEVGWKKAAGHLAKKGGQKIAQKAKDKVAFAGGLKDAVNAAKNTQGGNIIDKLRNAKNAYKNNSGVLGARQRKEMAKIKKEKRKAMIQGIASVAENAIMVAGGQRTMGQARENIANTLRNNEQLVGRAEKRMADAHSQSVANGENPYEGMHKEDVEKMAKQTGDFATFNPEDLNNTEMDVNGNNTTQTQDSNIGGITKDGTNYIGKTGFGVDQNGNIDTTKQVAIDKMTDQGIRVGVMTDASGNQQIFREAGNGESLKNFKPEQLMTIKNAMGQEQKVIKLDGHVTKNGQVVIKKGQPVKANIDNQYNNRANIDNIVQSGNLNAQSIQNIQQATFDIASASRQVDASGAPTAQAQAIITNAQNVLAKEKQTFVANGGKAEDFGAVTNQIHNVHIVNSDVYSQAIAKSAPDAVNTSELNSAVSDYRKLDNLEKSGKVLTEEQRETKAKAEDKLQSAGINPNDKAFKKLCAKAEKRTGNIKKKNKDLLG